jgi:ATP-dependent Clp protease ATP-binding subunit ClpX
MTKKNKEPPEEKKKIVCSFCGQPAEPDRLMIGGPKDLFICEACVEVCNKVFAEIKAKDS